MARELNKILANELPISSNYTSEAIELLFLEAGSFSAKFSNSAGLAGCSAYLEGSDIVIDTGGSRIASVDNDDWTKINGSDLSISTDTKYRWNIMKISCRWMRFKLVLSGGSLDLTLTVNGKSG